VCEGRVAKDHRANRKDLLVDSGAGFYNKLLLVGDLSRNREKNRM